MQRGIAVILALLFGCLSVLPAFATPNLTVPACCRKNGQHHCMMAQPGASGPAVSSIAAKCPCFPRATVASQAQSVAASNSSAIFAGLVRHPAGSPQSEAACRISYDRSRQKRGPPSLIL